MTEETNPESDAPEQGRVINMNINSMNRGLISLVTDILGGPVIMLVPRAVKPIGGGTQLTTELMMGGGLTQEMMIAILRGAAETLESGQEEDRRTPAPEADGCACGWCALIGERGPEVNVSETDGHVVPAPEQSE